MKSRLSSLLRDEGLLKTAGEVNSLKAAEALFTLLNIAEAPDSILRWASGLQKVQDTEISVKVPEGLGSLLSSLSFRVRVSPKGVIRADWLYGSGSSGSMNMGSDVGDVRLSPDGADKWIWNYIPGNKRGTVG